MNKLGPYELNRVHCGHILDMLPRMPDESVQCIVTSPPYWGLRDYKIPPSVWDADPDCRHEFAPTGAPGGNGDGKSFRRDKSAGRHSGETQPGFCVHCNAWRGCLGLEPTPELFIQHMVTIFRELRRVLRKDGTLWLNLGDSYAGGGGTSPNAPSSETSLSGRRHREAGGSRLTKKQSVTAGSGLKPKDLVGIPWRVAFALQADGWWLRSDIIWHKPNPMPESVTDRPTKAHEYIFLLTKSARYFYDMDAVREGYSRDPLTFGNTNRRKFKDDGSALYKGRKDRLMGIGYTDDAQVNPSGRNSRTVWTMPTQPTPEAHFATFPEELPRRCIKAGTSEKGACPDCGTPWERVVEKTPPPTETLTHTRAENDKDNLIQTIQRDGAKVGSGSKYQNWRDAHPATTTGWRPQCKCYDERYRREFARVRSRRKLYQQNTANLWWKRVRQRPGKDTWPTTPCIVLDPFAGTAKTGQVAIDLGRRFIGFDISAEYVRKFAQPRLQAAVIFAHAVEKGITIDEFKAGQKTLF